MASAERKPCCDGDRGEPRPAIGGVGEVLVDDGLAAVEAVEAGALGRLQLEQLDEAHHLTGRGDELQLTAGGDEHDAGGGDVEHLDAPVGRAS